MDLHYSQNRTKTLSILYFVLLPYGFTLLSNQLNPKCRRNRFYYLMDLHYSQTGAPILSRSSWFYYLMDLHYSQTWMTYQSFSYGFTTLWIYILSNMNSRLAYVFAVLLPYGFTLLSNLKFQSTFFAFRQQISGIQESKRRHYIASGNHKAALLYHYFLFLQQFRTNLYR